MVRFLAKPNAGFGGNQVDRERDVRKNVEPVPPSGSSPMKGAVNIDGMDNSH
jgi:hypothetical protein